MSQGNTSPAQETLVRVISRSAARFEHGVYSLAPGGVADVPKSVADLWCSHVAFGQPLVVIAGSESERKTAAANQAIQDSMKLENLSLKDKIAELERRLAASLNEKAGLPVESAPAVLPTAEAEPAKRGPGRPKKTADPVAPAQS